VASAYGHTFWWVVALTAVALVPTPLLPRLCAGRRDEATRYGDNDGSIAPSGAGASA
jgi:hypothetical protein